MMIIIIIITNLFFIDNKPHLSKVDKTAIRLRSLFGMVANKDVK